MPDLMCVCGHSAWDHEVDETIHEDGDESIIFGECCKCICSGFVESEESKDEE